MHWGNPVLSRYLSDEQPEDRSEWYYPSSADDVFTAALCLRQKLGHVDSNLAAHILNLARYWQRYTSVRADEKPTEPIDLSKAYLVSEPISGSGRNPVRRVSICIAANDTVRVFPPRWNELGFAVRIARRQRLGDLPASATEPQNDRAAEVADFPMLLGTHYTELADDRGHEYTVQRDVWKGNDPGSGLFEYLQTLRVGDRLRIVPPPRVREWGNAVNYARIEIYTSCLLASSFDD